MIYGGSRSLRLIKGKFGVGKFLGLANLIKIPRVPILSDTFERIVDQPGICHRSYNSHDFALNKVWPEPFL